MGMCCVVQRLLYGEPEGAFGPLRLRTNAKLEDEFKWSSKLSLLVRLRYRGIQATHGVSLGLSVKTGLAGVVVQS